MNRTMVPIVWHDLIEDPNDLPPISDDGIWSERVLIQTTSGDQFCASFHKLKCAEEGIWYDRNTMTELNRDAIEAWTHVPNYSNREKRIEKLLRKLPAGIVFHRIKEADNNTNEYPEPHQFVIVFQYKEGEGIVSTVGFYDKDMGWMMPTIFKANKLIDIDDVIGWSPFFGAKQ